MVNPIKGYSFEVVQSWTKPIDVLFIDASHEYESVYRDFMTWSPFVKVGGIVAFHDVSAYWPGPTRVMAEELQMPQFGDLRQVDSLAWATKQSAEYAAPGSSRIRTHVTVTKVDFEARQRETASFRNEVQRLLDAWKLTEAERIRLLTILKRAGLNTI